MNEDFNVIQIDDHTWRIEAGMVRAWLLTGEKKALLIDTTMTEGDLAGVVRSLTDLPLMVINTHADPDHISCNDQFETVYMHPADYELYKENAKAGYADPKPVEEGDRIDLGGRVFEVLHIPGHTPGSIALLDRENRTLISGDTVSANPVFMFGASRNTDDFRKSLLRLQSLSPEFDRIYTSHGPYCTDKSQIENELICLDECLQGKVSPEDPPFPMPAKMYRSHGAGFFLDL